MEFKRQARAVVKGLLQEDEEMITHLRVELEGTNTGYLEKGQPRNDHLQHTFLTVIESPK